MNKKILCMACILCMLMLFQTAIGEGDVIELPVDELGVVDLADDVESDDDETIESEALDAEYASAGAAFPDDAFREYVLNHFDANHNGVISSSEAKKVKTIDVSGLGVNSLQGIENFTKLKQLLCEDNPIQTVELGYCSELLKYVKEAAPRIVEGNMAFEHSKKIVVTLPLGTAITIKGKTFFDPALGLSLADNSKMLIVKDKHALLADGCGYPLAYCRFDVSDKSVLKVSGGTVTALKAGTATVTVTTFDGLTDSCVYVVKKAPSKVTLSQKSLSLGTGQQFWLEASVPSDCYAEYTWSSDNKKVATVEAGLISTHAAGKAKITVKTQNGKKATCELRLYAAPTSITLNVDSLNLMTEQTAKLKAALNSGAGGEVRFYSDAPGIAAVDAVSGAVTAVSEGSARVWAETYNGLKATCEVTVMAGPESIFMDDAKLLVGQTIDLGALALTADGRDVSGLLSFSSGNAKVASVTADGRVSGLKLGNTTITASAPNGKKATCRVTVGAPTTSIRLDRTELRLRFDEDEWTGETFPLTATLNVGAFSEVTFESDAEDVAIVSADGRVTAMGAGHANITARTDNDLTAVCAVTVTIRAKFPTGQTIVVAHRGGLSCGPENTLAAFSNSASTGAEMIELDVRTTKDKVLVINHDAKIKNKKIKEKNYSELLKLKPDLCTLDQALDVIDDSGLLLQVELKDTANVDLTVSAVRAHHMEDRVIYISFEKELLRKVRKLDADARLGFIFMDSVPSGLDSFIDELDISALMVHKKLLTQTRLNNWHARGLQVNVWTIDTYDECVSWISMGVDYITSNYPEIAVRARG